MVLIWNLGVYWTPEWGSHIAYGVSVKKIISYLKLSNYFFYDITVILP